MVADVVVEHVAPIRQRIVKYLNDKNYLLDVLRNGAEKAGNIAETTAEQVRNRLGIRPENNITRLYARNK